MSEINGIGTPLRLRWARSGETPNISVYLVNTARSHRVHSTGEDALDGYRIGNAVVIVQRNGGTIKRGVIAFSRSLRRSEIRSIALEELYQAMGFMHDIKNPAYRNKSIFDDWGSAITKLTGQDSMVLRRKYR